MANKVNVDLELNAHGYVDGLNQATQATADYETETKKVKDATVNLNKELRNAKNDVKNLAAGYARLSQEEKNSQFGKEMARQLQDAKERAAELIDLQGDLNTELRNMASDTATFDSLGQGMSTFMNITSAASGVVAQFTGNEEDAKRAVLMFTTAQSTLNAVTQIQNALQKQSSLMLGVQRIQTLAATAAVNLKTAAEGKNVIMTKAATVAQSAFNAVAAMNPYVLLAMAVVGLVAGLAIFISSTSDATSEQEKANKAMEDAKARAEDLNKTFNDSTRQAHMTAERFRHLEIELLNMKDEFGKTAMIEEAAKIMKEYGISVKNTDEVQQFMVKNGQKFIELLRAQGDAAAYAAVKQKVFEEEFNKLRGEGMSAASAALQAANAQEVRDLDDLVDVSRSRIAYLQKELGIQSDLAKAQNKNNNKEKKDEEARAGSLAALRNEYSKYKQEVEKGIRTKPIMETFEKDFKAFEDKIKEKEIELKIKEPDAKDIPGTQAWYNDKIKGLEGQLEKLPLNAVVEREKIQEQLDAMKSSLKLQIEGITIIGSKAIGDAFNNNVKHNINDIQNAISALEGKLKSTDWSEIGVQEGERSLDDYINKIIELKTELANMQKDYDTALMTPVELANKKLEDTQQQLSQVNQLLSTAGDLFGELGQLSQDNGLKATAIIAKAIATVIMSYAEALKSASKNWVTWLAFGMSGLATLTSMVGQLKALSAGNYATGGVVGGSSYYGDRLTANVNSGEMILNRRQQQNMFNLLDTGTMSRNARGEVVVTGDVKVRGTDLIIAMRNDYNKNSILS